MLAWIKSLLGQPSEFSRTLEAIDKMQQRYDERLKQALDSLDRVIAAKFDRPTIAETQRMVVDPVFDASTLSDILSSELTDEQFIERASQTQ